ncbi:hypothetical protein M514_05779 [Trichuris suis]|uniref:DUF5641 domain-containing protein n=1 Tax=Trichuris suis TaxID=68888 RepID=A0A085M7V2_9BILA|nr:hypothetical protein M513_05779 [Trichuris suis]KFD66385.1 hypothetical protein M514_05779 [Trichuris suis]
MDVVTFSEFYSERHRSGMQVQFTSPRLPVLAPLDEGMLPFLAFLQKCQRTKEQLRKDDVVLIVDASNPRGVWPMGRIIHMYPGPDGIVRVVNVRYLQGIMGHPVSRLVRLASQVSDKPETAGKDVVA